MARVLMVASEATPFVKTGGLADVLGGLPPALAALGENVAVLLPKYRRVELFGAQRVYHDLPVWLAGTRFAVSLDQVTHKGVPYYFANCPSLYDREGIYNANNVDYPDNHIRFAVLCRTALEMVRRVFRPQVIHCHDWQGSLVAPYLRRTFTADPTYIGLKTLLTIHNLGYQGIFGPSALTDLGLDLSVFTPETLEFFGNINLLKGGIVFSDRINTVSEAYAREIQTPEFGFGLDGLLRSRTAVLSGILNGVDYSEWDPRTDRYLKANYGPERIEPKAEDKRALIEEFGLGPENEQRPLIGIVSRLTAMKGFDLVAEVADELLAEDVALVALGTGEPAFEQFFRDLAARAPDRIGARIGFDEALAHRVEAGVDMFLMPSRYEPCGLNQIYSLRYGAAPIVRATGGLDDTIDESVGFKFRDYSGLALLDAVRTAVSAFRDQQRWRELIRRGMERDFSWNVSARKYSDLYRLLMAEKVGSTAA